MKKIQRAHVVLSQTTYKISFVITYFTLSLPYRTPCSHILILFVINSIPPCHVTRNKGFIREFDEETAQRIFDYGIKALSPIGVLGDPSGASSDGLALNTQ